MSPEFWSCKKEEDKKELIKKGKLYLEAAGTEIIHSDEIWSAAKFSAAVSDADSNVVCRFRHGESHRRWSTHRRPPNGHNSRTAEHNWTVPIGRPNRTAKRWEWPNGEPKGKPNESKESAGSKRSWILKNYQKKPLISTTTLKKVWNRLKGTAGKKERERERERERIMKGSWMAGMIRNDQIRRPCKSRWKENLKLSW